MTTTETMTTSSTGGSKGQKLARFDLIPAGPLWALAEMYGQGCGKYEEDQWRRGYAWSLSFAALNRHLWQFWSGEWADPEHGQPHLASVLFHAMTLMEFHDTAPQYDDRPLWRHNTMPVIENRSNGR